MTKLTKAEFYEKFDPDVHDQLDAQLAKPGVTGLALFENVDFCSSAFGARTACIVGPACTFKTAADCEGKWLNDLPSQRQYAQAYYEKEAA